MAIKIKASHKGKLHKALGVKKGKKLTSAEISKAKNSKNPKVRKEATFAANAKKWKHGGKKKGGRNQHGARVLG